VENPRLLVALPAFLGVADQSRQQAAQVEDHSRRFALPFLTAPFL
jgi:hypothetical protein